MRVHAWCWPLMTSSEQAREAPRPAGYLLDCFLKESANQRTDE